MKYICTNYLKYSNWSGGMVSSQEWKNVEFEDYENDYHSKLFLSAINRRPSITKLHYPLLVYSRNIPYNQHRLNISSQSRKSR